MADAAPQAERVAVGPGRVEDATSADMLVEADSEPQSLVEADR